MTETVQLPDVFELPLADNNDRASEFTKVLLRKGSKLREFFEKTFDIHLNSYAPADNNMVTISYHAMPDKADVAKAAIVEAFNRFKKKEQLCEKMVTEIAEKLKNKPVQTITRNTATEQGNVMTFGKTDKKNRDKGGEAKAFNDNSSQTPAKGPYVLTPRNDAQRGQIAAIEKNDITFAVGAAGTGKTHIAMAMAVKALDTGAADKIFIARPAISNGKDLGALPGDVKEKLAPFMQPIYDELIEVLGSQKILDAKMAAGKIVIVPVEMMRGRTLKRAFIVVDEAQNCTDEQMKMCLTRLGEGSKMVLTGDPEQVDLPPTAVSGFKPAYTSMQGIEGIGAQFYTSKDIVRHPLIGAILKTYEDRPKSEAVVKKDPNDKVADAFNRVADNLAAVLQEIKKPVKAKKQAAPAKN